MLLHSVTVLLASIVWFIVTKKGCCTMLIPTCYAISPSSYSLLQMHRYYCHSSLYPCIHVPCIRDILIQSAPHTMFRRTGRHSQNFGWDNIWSRHVSDVHVVTLGYWCIFSFSLWRAPTSGFTLPEYMKTPSSCLHIKYVCLSTKTFNDRKFDVVKILKLAEDYS